MGKDDSFKDGMYCSIPTDIITLQASDVHRAHVRCRCEIVAIRRRAVVVEKQTFTYP